METVNIHEAKTHLSRLLEGVSRGETYIIAKAGHPVARLSGYQAEPAAIPQRLGFLRGQIEVPDDFDRMADEAIQQMFGGPDEPAA